MIRLTMNGPEIVRDAEWAAQQDTFRKRHAIRFERFVAPPVLARLRPMLRSAGAQFEPREHWHDGKLIAREMTLPGDLPLAMFLYILLNQPSLFAAIGEFAGFDETIRRFEGRCYRMSPGGGEPSPGGEHFDTWHSDWGDGRRFGLSINLSVEPVTGGEFQIRLRDRQEIIRTIAPSRFGDATLFRIDPALCHRVRPVRGAASRCSYAGWFTLIRTMRWEYA